MKSPSDARPAGWHDDEPDMAPAEAAILELLDRVERLEAALRAKAEDAEMRAANAQRCLSWRQRRRA